MYQILSKIPQSILRELTRTNVIIPYYHVVSDNEVIHVKHLYQFKNIRQFKQDLDYLLRNYSPTSLFEFLGFLKGGCSIPRKIFLLTFDDGFREINDVVAPILLAKGICGTFFVNSAFIDNKRMCYLNKASILVERILGNLSSGLKGKLFEMLRDKGIECNDIPSGILSIRYNQEGLLDEIAEVLEIGFEDYLLKNKPYLTSDQINGLIGKGFAIGAHSIDHPFYPLLSLSEQLRQTIESVREIRGKFFLNYGAFAFPHSDTTVTEEFFAELHKSGLVDVSFGTGGMIRDCISNNFQRISLEKPLMPAKRIIALQFARKATKMITGRGEIFRSY